MRSDSRNINGPEAPTCPRCGLRIAETTGAPLCAKCLLLEGLAPCESPRILGDYELIEEIARGGMGVVFKARQRSLNRVVAVKLILWGRYAAPEVVERFRGEARAAAQLQHPNIVAIHDIGEHEGQHYFSMDYVAGNNLETLARHRPIGPARAARLLQTLAQAVHHAHRHGILHRDLKPSNILIDAQDQPHLTDFGLARALEGGPELTLSGQVLGSPNFMSPEQAAGRTGQVGVRSDVYSLGAVLYYLLTGRLLFPVDTITEVLELVKNAEPVSPRLVNPRTPCDLETICLKCLQKEPEHRYGSAADLAEDLRRYLAWEPIRARPPSAVHRFRKWGRRNKLVLASGCVAVLALLLVVAGSVLYAVQERRDARDLQRQLARQYLRRGQALCESGEAGRGLHWLAHARRATPDGSPVLSAVIEENLLAWGKRCMAPVGLLEVGLGFHKIVPTIDGSRAVAGNDAETTVAQWSLATGARIAPGFDHPLPVTILALSRDGRTLLTLSNDGIGRAWSMEDGRLLAVLEQHNPISALAIGPDGDRALTGCRNGAAQFWSIRDRRVLFDLPTTNGRRLTAVALSHDGARLLTADEAGNAEVWRTDPLGPLGVSRHHETQISAAAFSPDHLRFATASWDGTARLWATDTGEAVGSVMRHEREVAAVAFSPDGERLLTGSFDRTARLWCGRTAAPVGLPMRHDDLVQAVEFSADGRTAFVSTHRRLYRWALTAATPRWVALGEGWCRAVAFSPDGRQALIGNDRGEVGAYAVPGGLAVGEPLAHGRGAVWCLDFSPDGQTLLTAGNDPLVRLWSGKRRDPAPPGLPHPDGIRVARFSPDGGVVATACWDGAARLWSTTDHSQLGGDLPHPGFVEDLEFSPDGQRLATACSDGTSRIWSRSSGQLLRELPGQRAQGSAVAFSPDGRLIATGSHDRTARLWNAASGRPTGVVLEHPDSVEDVCFNLAGDTLLTAGADRAVRFWSIATGEQTRPPLVNDAPVIELALSPDRTLLLTGADGVARLWTLAEDAAVPDREFQLRHADLWVETLTMMQMDESGVLGWLDSADWHRRREQLRQFATPGM